MAERPKVHSFTLQGKLDRLAQGKPFIVASREAAKTLTKSEYNDTGIEVLLGCIIVSGCLDTAELLKIVIHINSGCTITDEQRQVYEAFRRVWAAPTEEETKAVLDWAGRIAGNPKKRMIWNKPS